jgi:hypothetical protein
MAFMLDLQCQQGDPISGTNDTIDEAQFDPVRGCVDDKVVM